MPKFIKNGLIMEVNAVCANLFHKQGWEPYVEVKSEVVTNSIPFDSNILDNSSASVDGGNSNDDAVKSDIVSDISKPSKLSRREVMRMTKDALLSAAKDRGYTITADKRTDIIEEFLKLQGE